MRVAPMYMPRTLRINSGVLGAYPSVEHDVLHTTRVGLLSQASSAINYMVSRIVDKAIHSGIVRDIPSGDVVDTYYAIASISQGVTGAVGRHHNLAIDFNVEYLRPSDPVFGDYALSTRRVISTVLLQMAELLQGRRDRSNAYAQMRFSRYLDFDAMPFHVFGGDCPSLYPTVVDFCVGRHNLEAEEPETDEDREVITARVRGMSYFPIGIVAGAFPAGTDIPPSSIVRIRTIGGCSAGLELAARMLMRYAMNRYGVRVIPTFTARMLNVLGDNNGWLLTLPGVTRADLPALPSEQGLALAITSWNEACIQGIPLASGDPFDGILKPLLLQQTLLAFTRSNYIEDIMISGSLANAIDQVTELVAAKKE